MSTKLVEDEQSRTKSNRVVESQTKMDKVNQICEGDVNKSIKVIGSQAKSTAFWGGDLLMWTFLDCRTREIDMSHVKCNLWVHHCYKLD